MNFEVGDTIYDDLGHECVIDSIHIYAVQTVLTVKSTLAPYTSTVDVSVCRKIMPNQTFPLSEYDIEAIHRVFGGIKIREDTVRTVDTGGGVMNDIYDTACGQIVVVYEYGAMMFKDMEGYGANDILNTPIFEWNEPLYSVQELTNEYS